MPIESLLTTIFFLETKSLPPMCTKRHESEPNLPKPKLLLPNAGRSNRHCLSIEKTPNRQRSGKLTMSSPPRRLIAPSLLTTEIVARSKLSSSKKLLLHEKLPKPPKGASKLTSFRAILAVRMHAACGPKVFLLLRALASPSTSAVVCAIEKTLDRCSATHC